MPFHIENDNPDCEGFAVIDEADASVESCHATQAEAQAHMDELMAAEDAPTDAEADPDLVALGDEVDAILEVEYSGERMARADKTGREERRGTLELREDPSGSGSTVFGYASAFDSPYTVTDMFGEYEETVRSGAFSRTIAEQDVRLYVNHDGMALARSSVNLTLAEDDHGLAYSADLDPTVTVVSDLTKLMRAGIMRESSFAFQPIRQKWNADYTKRDLLEVKLYDVSVVSLPANPAASAGVRNAELVRWLTEVDPLELAGELRSAGVGAASVLEAVSRLATAAGEAREGKVLSAGNAKLVRDAVDALQALLDAAAPRDASAMIVEQALMETLRRRRR